MVKEENTPKEYNGKQYTTYEALQQQRKMERGMRAQRQKIKLLQEGGADEQEIILAKVPGANTDLQGFLREDETSRAESQNHAGWSEREVHADKDRTEDSCRICDK